MAVQLSTKGLVVDCATQSDMDDEEQEVEWRVRDEEPVLLLGSPMCRAFSTLIELTTATCKLGEVRFRNLVERCVRHLRFCFRMYETQRSAGRLFTVMDKQRTARRWTYSVKSIGSTEVGVTCEESNVLELDEHAELQNVFDNICRCASRPSVETG